jgi:hypothetical protein
MAKRNINVIYDKNLDKKELFENAKSQVLNLYQELIENYNNSDINKINTILNKIDKNTNYYFKVLFLLSLYCSYYHKIKNKLNSQTINSLHLKDECFKRYNFVILDLDDNHVNILKALTMFLNTDAEKLETRYSGKLLEDLNKIQVYIQSK